MLLRLQPCGGAQASRSTNARGPGAVRLRHTGTEPNQKRAQLPLLGALQKHSLQQELETLQRCAKPRNWTRSSDRIRDAAQQLHPLPSAVGIAQHPS